MRIHFIAIGGSAMHNLAIALHRNGHQITALLNVISRTELDQLLTSYYMSMVGASGALYGILVAFAFSKPIGCIGRMPKG